MCLTSNARKAPKRLPLKATMPPPPEKKKYIVGCQGVIQLGGPDHWYNQGGLAKVGAG